MLFNTVVAVPSDQIDVGITAAMILQLDQAVPCIASAHVKDSQHAAACLKSWFFPEIRVDLYHPFFGQILKGMFVLRIAPALVWNIDAATMCLLPCNSWDVSHAAHCCRPVARHPAVCPT